MIVIKFEKIRVLVKINRKRIKPNEREKRMVMEIPKEEL